MKYLPEHLTVRSVGIEDKSHGPIYGTVIEAEGLQVPIFSICTTNKVIADQLGQNIALALEEALYLEIPQMRMVESSKQTETEPVEISSVDSHPSSSDPDQS